MKFALIALLFAAPAFAADGFGTTIEYRADFETASACNPIDGRKVWKGEQAFYIQSWLFQTGQSGVLDEESADAIPVKGNDKEALAAFEAACA